MQIIPKSLYISCLVETGLDVMLLLGINSNDDNVSRVFSNLFPSYEVPKTTHREEAYNPENDINEN